MDQKDKVAFFTFVKEMSDSQFAQSFFGFDSPEFISDEMRQAPQYIRINALRKLNPTAAIEDGGQLLLSDLKRSFWDVQWAKGSASRPVVSSSKFDI